MIGNLRKTDQASNQLYRTLKRTGDDLSSHGQNIVTSTVYRLRASTESAFLLVVLLGFILAITCSACADTRTANDLGPSSDDPWAIAEASADARWLPVLATQDLAVGVKRIAFSLDGLGANEPPPTVRVSLFDLERDRESPSSVQYARFLAYDPDVTISAHGHVGASISDRSLPIGRGVYVVPVRLDAAGVWGILLDLSADDVEESVRLRFSVRERAAAPSVGEQAPKTESRTRADVSALSEITSDPEPEPGLYAVSIAEALAMERPLIVTFATPAFCHSRTCAPVLESVKAVWREWSAQVTAIHVEVFENPQEPSRLAESEAFAAWRLPSEPWVFVIDASGVIRYAFEGAVTELELRSALEWIVQEAGS